MNDNDDTYTFSIEGATVSGNSTWSSTYDTYDFGTVSPTTITLDAPIADSNITFDVDNINIIDISEIEDMCTEYPALEKVWRNFKTLYDMTLQDYKGKQKERGFDDKIPF
jgi:hypothetical protein